MARAALHLLGCPTLIDAAGSPVSGGPVQRHRIALLALLAMAAPKGVSRDRLIGLLWPDRDAPAARRLLNVAVAVLRQALGADAIVSAGDDLRLGEHALLVDAVEFERAADAGSLEAAVEMSRGPFLEGFYLDDAEDFERWVDSQRLRLARRYTAALTVLANRATADGNLVNAAAWWRALNHAEPTNTRVVLQLFDALAKSGDAAAALAVEEAHAAYMRSEIGVEPDAELVRRGRALRASLTDARQHADVPKVVPVRTPPETPPFTVPVSRRRWRIIAAAGVLAMVGTAVAVQVSAGARPGSDQPLLATIEPLAADSTVADFVRDDVTHQLQRNLEQVDGVNVVVLDRRRAAPRRAASFRVVGRLRRSGDELTAFFTLTDSVGATIGSSTASAPADAAGVLALVDHASLELVRLMWGRRWRVPAPRLGAITTRSLPALEHFMRGERHFRTLVFDSAAVAFEEAVHLDSTFALASFRLGEVNAWRSGFGVAATLDPLERALRHADKLTPREVALLRLYLQHQRTEWEAHETARNVVSQYPEDAEARYMLADIVFHSRVMRGVDLDTQFDMWDQAIEADPFSLRPLSHVFELALGEPTAERYDRYLAIRRNRAAFDSSDAQSRWRVIRWGSLRAARDTMQAIIRAVAARRAHPAQIVDARDVLMKRCLSGSENCGDTAEWFLGVLRNTFRARPDLWSWDARTRTALTLGSGRVSPADPAYADFETVARLIVFGYAPRAMVDSVSVLLERELDRSWKYHMRRATLMLARGEGDSAAAAIDAAVRHVDELAPEDRKSIPYFAGYTRAMRGWVLAVRGDTARAITELRAALGDASYSGIAVEAMTPFIDLLAILVSRQPSLREEGIARLRVNLGGAGYYWPYLRLVLARALDANGEAAAAAAEYDGFAFLWRDADPELQHLVADASARSRELRRGRS